MSKEDLEVKREDLTKECDPDDLGFETTDEVDPL